MNTGSFQFAQPMSAMWLWLAAVAAVLHDAGATKVVVAARPDENALLEALDRTMRPSLE